jgi:hypothetical protein
MYTAIDFSAKAFSNWYNVANVRAGAYIYGQFPNPFYANGAFDGRVRIGRRINFSFHRNFEKGQYCATGAPVTGEPDPPAEDKAMDLSSLIRSVGPSGLGDELNRPFNVVFNLTPDEVVEVMEAQGDGTSVLRSFKLQINQDRTSQLRTNDDQPPLDIPLNRLTHQVNDLGAHEYVITTLSTSGLSNQAVNPSISISPVGGTTNTQLNPGTTSQGSQTMMNGVSPTSSSGGISSGQLSLGMSLPPNPAIAPIGQMEDDFEFVQPLENRLQRGRLYEFTISATLMELTNGNWVPAKDKSGNTITQVKRTTYNTGYINKSKPKNEASSIQLNK